MNKPTEKSTLLITAFFSLLLLLFLPAAAHSADVSLNWTAPDDDRVTGYHIYYGPSNPAFKTNPAIIIETAEQTECRISDLQAGVTYYFAATSVDADENESDFSETISYGVPRAATNADGDGDTDTESSGGADGTDTSTSPGGPDENTDDNADNNADGIPDAQQSNVVSLAVPTADTNKTITLASPPGTRLENCRLIEPLPANPPPDAVFEWGFYAFTITGIPEGGAAELEIRLPEGASPTDYIKYGPTPAKPYDHWYTFLDNGQTGAALNGSVITLYFVDGANGDANLVPDGKIIDPGGPFYTTASASTDQTDSDANDPPNSSDSDEGASCFIKSLDL